MYPVIKRGDGGGRERGEGKDTDGVRVSSAENELEESQKGAIVVHGHPSRSRMIEDYGRGGGERRNGTFQEREREDQRGNVARIPGIFHKSNRQPFLTSRFPVDENPLSSVTQIPKIVATVGNPEPAFVYHVDPDVCMCI